jgi:hypothetical protein
MAAMLLGRRLLVDGAHARRDVRSSTEDLNRAPVPGVPMQPYANDSGESGISAFEIGPGFLRVRFIGGATYLYTRERPGSARVEVMKELALRGRGLAAFISRFVLDDYERRET